MKKISVSVPGKVMLVGEYAVLKGGTAIACAVDAAMTVTATASARKGRMSACSDYLGSDQVFSNEGWQTGQWKTEQAVLEHILTTLTKEYPAQSLHFEVVSKLNVNFGTGSSSALRLACALAAAKFQAGTELALTDRWDAARLAWKMQSEAQGENASGYDVATQLLGGVVSMRYPGVAHLWPGTIVQHRQSLGILQKYVTVLVNGRGSKTSPLVKNTCNWLDEHKMWDQLLQMSDDFSAAWVQLLSMDDPTSVLPELYEHCAQHRQFFLDTPAANGAVFSALKHLEGIDRGWTYKTTGAGGDDAMILLGESTHKQAAIDQMLRNGWAIAPFAFTQTGSIIGEQE